MKKHILTQDGEEKFSGTEDQCFMALLRMQGMSTAWAMRHEGWKITPTDEDIEDPRQEATFIKKEGDTAIITFKGEEKRINQRYIYGTLGQLKPGENFFIDSTYIQNKL